VTISNLVSGFDRYARNARLYPGLLAASPIIIFVIVLIPSYPAMALIPMTVGVGATFALSHFVRDRGLRIEGDLLQRWDGWPTTRRLRHREVQNSVSFARRRRGLERLSGESLPTEDAERLNPLAADEMYVAVTRCLIAHVRDQSAEFPRVQDENISYGFARNMFALRPIALCVAFLAILADGVYAYGAKPTASLIIIVCTHCLAIAVWFWAVNEPWVRRAGERYADRLFEVMENPQFWKLIDAEASASAGRQVEAP